MSFVNHSNEAHQEAKTLAMPYSELLGRVHSMVAREWAWKLPPTKI
jgi:hypothetical protein